MNDDEVSAALVDQARAFGLSEDAIQILACARVKRSNSVRILIEPRRRHWCCLLGRLGDGDSRAKRILRAGKWQGLYSTERLAG